MYKDRGGVGVEIIEITSRIPRISLRLFRRFGGDYRATTTTKTIIN